MACSWNAVARLLTSNPLDSKREKKSLVTTNSRLKVYICCNRKNTVCSRGFLSWLKSSRVDISNLASEPLVLNVSQSHSTGGPHLVRFSGPGNLYVHPLVQPYEAPFENSY